MPNLHLTKVPVHELLSQLKTDHNLKTLDLNDPVFRHRAIMGLFGAIDSKKPREHGGILFRLDQIPGQPPFFLVQSRISPQTQSYETRELPLPDYKEGDIVQFTTALNGVRRKTTENSGKRQTKVSPVPLFKPEDTDQFPFDTWVKEKMSSLFSDTEIVNHRRSVLKSKIHPNLTIQVDDVDGIATICDPEALRTVMSNGIGREKSYGCGLVSVRLIKGI
ncbi:CRISPR-associated protein [Corynebacterium glutamicum R]|uniref:CRISPR-associated protein n=1 Tax=Corynebacterium glutamicum (strain R) TaxID=340322 RepID=A0AB72VFS4_CORGB|nr:CRISPR-associated protein [Corynebacterium glutamicum R]